MTKSIGYGDPPVRISELRFEAGTDQFNFVRVFVI
jgi:hypothetical protein